jgi:hypothetical protein
MDLDKQISALEGKSTFVNLGSKAIFVRLGISLVFSFFIIYISKSLHVFTAEYDSKEKEIKLSLNYKNFLIASTLCSVLIFFILGHTSYFE